MYRPLPLFIGLRYTRAKRRNQFISFVSLVSLLGMILGVAALVIVTSVMNGFEGELRQRILAVVPHGYISGPERKLSDWPRWQRQVSGKDGVIAAAPFIDGTVMLSRPGVVRGARLYAIDPGAEAAVSKIATHMVDGSLDQLQAGQYQIVLGDILARYLGVYPGDELSVILPSVTVSPVGIFPRVKRFTVSGTFKVGADLDSSTVFIHLSDGQKLFQLGTAVNGLRLQFDDLFAVNQHLPAIEQGFPEGSVATGWSQTQGSLFKAVKMEKTMVSLLLMIIVMIAAFNIVSIVTMMVSDKRADIAVLRTMGASPGAILQVFMIQGVAVGLVGVFIGLSFGIPIALNIGTIVAGIETALGGQLFNPQVYFISRIPSELKHSDLLVIAASGFVLSIIATIYPAFRAAKVHPAEALRYE